MPFEERRASFAPSMHDYGKFLLRFRNDFQSELSWFDSVSSVAAGNIGPLPSSDIAFFT